MQNTTHIMPTILVALGLAWGTPSAHSAAGVPLETFESLEIHGTGTYTTHLNATDEQRLIAALKQRHTHPAASKDKIMALFDVRHQEAENPSQAGHFLLDEPTVEKALSMLAPGQDISWDVTVAFLDLIGVRGITSGALAAEQQAYDAARAAGRRFQSALDGPLTPEDAALKDAFMAIGPVRDVYQKGLDATADLFAPLEESLHPTDGGPNLQEIRERLFTLEEAYLKQWTETQAHLQASGTEADTEPDEGDIAPAANQVGENLAAKFQTLKNTPDAAFIAAIKSALPQLRQILALRYTE